MDTFATGSLVKSPQFNSQPGTLALGKSHPARGSAFPLFLVTLGTGWLLTARGVFPGVNWLWVLALGGAGALCLLLWGLDKATFFIGSMLMLTSVASVLRQTGRLDLNTEVPSLVIASGVLMILARWLPIRWPEWVREMQVKG